MVAMVPGVSVKQSEELITLPLTEGLSVRLYPDSRPSNLEIGGLHKGLILIADGKELVEEGAGLGVPVAVYGDKTYFPGSSRVDVLHTYPPTIRKTYELNMVSRKSIMDLKISDAVYRPFHAVFHAAYVSAPHLRPILNGVMRLREEAGIETSFEKGENRGSVPVTYMVSTNEIAVEVDLSNLRAEGLVEVAVLNEQGARFSVYSDSDNVTLRGNRIGGWDIVSAGECTLSDPSSGASFTLSSIDGARLRRGREAVKNRFSWAGLNYSLCNDTKKFRYLIHVRSHRV
jgi:hypothetical protein